jgi:urease accessory protein UreH
MSLPARHHGCLVRELACNDGRTAIASQHSRPPLQTFGLQAADRSGGAYLQIVNPRGRLFEGDSAEVEVSLQRGLHLNLTVQAATKLYPAEHGEITQQHIRLHVASGAILEYFTLPLIPFARSLYVQEMTIQVESGGLCIVAEILAPGRVARGERLAYSMVRSRVEGWVDGQLALFEQIILQPEENSYVGLGILDGKGYVASLYVLTSQALDRWIPEWNRRLTEQYGEYIGITALAQWGTRRTPSRPDRTGSLKTPGCCASVDSRRRVGFAAAARLSAICIAAPMKTPGVRFDSTQTDPILKKGTHSGRQSTPVPLDIRHQNLPGEFSAMALQYSAAG